MKLRIVEINEKSNDKNMRIDRHYVVQKLVNFILFEHWSTQGYFFGEDSWKPYRFNTYEQASAFVEGYCKKESFKVLKVFECEGV